jgi:hypothetical protein
MAIGDPSQSMEVSRQVRRRAHSNSRSSDAAISVGGLTTITASDARAEPPHPWRSSRRGVHRADRCDGGGGGDRRVQR